VIAVLDYEAGNLTSVELALRHVGAQPVVTADPEAVLRAERVVFPGVGAAGTAMATLRARGLDEALREVVRAGVPVLGICIGMQLAFGRSAEDGGVDCLGLLPGEVVRFEAPPEAGIKIPHMGWNAIRPTRPHPLLQGLPDGAECYFVHSYYPVPAEEPLVACRTEYAGVTFASAAGRENLFVTQFHPEKSGEVGLGILRNFLAWDGTV
jgi:glutamine amidotransferase